uniref:WD repeat-containing protein 91 homolog isoform X1 n=1 Tax=Rhizophora mucronata TaxID=61149 RepID=A0A2P2KKK6_RHIMU
MENMRFAEEAVREFLVFRGFTTTLQAFETELSTDIGKGFHVDRILELIFGVYIPKFQAERLLGLLTFFKQRLSTLTETVLLATLSKLEVSLLRYYLVYASQAGRKDKVMEFFGLAGNDLLQRDHRDWSPWFSIPYLKNPSLDPQFRVYFSKEWNEALRLSVRNFFSEVFNGTRIPALLKISSEKNIVNHLRKDIKQLNLKLSQLQALLEEKEGQLQRLRSGSSAASTWDLGTGQAHSSALSSGVHDENHSLSTSYKASCIPATPNLGETMLQQESAVSGRTTNALLIAIPDTANESCSVAKMEDGKTGYAHPMMHDDTCKDGGGEIQSEEEFPEVKVDFQETFLGHTSPISRCRFSASGNNIASASVDGTVRIWTYESSASTSRNATIYCGAEIMSLDWECKSDRLLLVGTADGGIKAWNVDAKRVVCDLNTSEAFPSVLDLKCSPVEPIFVSASASRRHGPNYIDTLGYASLTVWNMKTWRAMAALPLGEDPPAITSVCFNHNGKILAASATDGMIHMFDMSAGLQITGWPAHDSAISSILFGPDETSIFSLGSDGKIFEWSLQNQGHVLWSTSCHRFSGPKTLQNCRHEMALDANGRRLLVTSGSVRAPIYQVNLLCGNAYFHILYFVALILG